MLLFCRLVVVKKHEKTFISIKHFCLSSLYRTVLPSSTVQTYGLSATATATSTATFRATSAATFRATSTATFRATSAATRAATPSASLSYENIASTSSLKPHASVTSAVQPSSTSSPPSSSGMCTKIPLNSYSFC